ncbi:hypothetical protein EBH_0031650 [Eimeria brunetti]|uniref:Uncharacterized protein n=1 Tax=Eimeria brunetti TaxID=51314 RepID=U6LQW6_9EIME|nr:hypothetical protein EBH_0031650 [Eimeria brunetti]
MSQIETQMSLCDRKILGVNLGSDPERRELRYESKSDLGVKDEETPIKLPKGLSNRKSRLCSLDLHAMSNQEPRHKFNITQG